RSGIARDGYDQACSFARAVAKRSGFAHKTLLRRVKHTKQQKYLDVSERMENVKGMFGIKNGDALKGKNVILVDDLVTTGATVSEAASVLYECGARKVICVCIARSKRKESADSSQPINDR
ncbi:MAG: ComF family protein, partial [Eubacteriales bacterium]